MGLRLKFYAVVAVVALLLIGTIVFLIYGWRGEAREHAELESAFQVLRKVDKLNRAEIDRLVAENHFADADVARLQREREQIIEKNNAELGRAVAELEKLRQENETLDNFLNTPVPGDFLRWLSKRDRADRGEVGAGAGDHDRAPTDS